MGHALPGPQLRLAGPGEVAGNIVALGPHDGLGNPEVLPFQPPDIIQAERDFVGREGFLFPAPDRVVVIGRRVQAFGGPGIVKAPVQAPAGEVVNDHGPGGKLPNQAGLKVQEIAKDFAPEPLPVQPQGGIMGGDGGSGKGNLVKIIVFLGPEGSPVGVIETVNVPIELFAEIPAERLPAPGAPA